MRTIKVLLGFLFAFFVFYLVPAWLSHYDSGLLLSFSGSYPVGMFFLLAGIVLILWTISLFAFVGRGTPSPYAPPEKLVVTGPYQYSRNPMALGVFSLLLGEAFLWEASLVFLYLVAVALFMHFIFIPREERDLANRFGHDYIEYMRNVPRWIPRIRFRKEAI